MRRGVVVLDASPLNHFARAGRLETLRSLLASQDCVTTKAVLGELRAGAQRHPEIGEALALPWVTVVPCDELPVLYLFAQYMNHLGDEDRNGGEASVLAWAEHHGATAYVDDQVACNIGRRRGVTVRRSLQLIVNAVRDDRMSEDDAQDLVRSLVDAEARLPAAAADDLFGWARSTNLL